MFRAYTVARKLALVGLVLIFGRGSVLQLASALFVAIVFMMAQGMVQPLKLPFDNHLRLSTELHTVITILIAITIKADPEAQSNKSVYDVVMVLTFLFMVALPFVAVVVAKVQSVYRALEPVKVNRARVKLTAAQKKLELLKKEDSFDKEDMDVAVEAVKTAQEELKKAQRKAKVEGAAGKRRAGGMQMAIRRFQLGLQDSTDQKTTLDYFNQLTVGQQLWRDKIIASHLTAEEMGNTLAELERQLPKSHALGYHFTNLDSVKLVLDSIGIRASNVGQLGGGVSICLTSPVELGWNGFADASFTKVVGKALWGSKWYEVMAGNAPVDLRQQIRDTAEVVRSVQDKFTAAKEELDGLKKDISAKKADLEAAGNTVDKLKKELEEAQEKQVKGDPETVQKEWGSCNKKLEAVFVVKIPSEDNIDPRRMVPGRKDVFIIPKSDCVPDEKNEYYYYQNENILRCFILAAPNETRPNSEFGKVLKRAAQGKLAQRVTITSTRDKFGGMDEISVKAGATTADKDEENPKGWYAEVLKTTAVVALYPKPLDAVAMHREVEKAKAELRAKLQKEDLEREKKEMAEKMRAEAEEKRK